MSAASGTPEPAASGAADVARKAGAAVRRHWFALAVGALMLVALVLRLWGHRVGLPYVYNVDEGAHFVPRAVGMFDHSYDPGYFINPPGLTYLLHVAFWLRWGGDETRHLMATDPGAVYGYARVIVAVLSALSVGALAWAAQRLFEDRRIALVAAGLLAVAFLPVFYGHFALNDAAVVLPVCVSLAGTAGVLRTGRTRDYVIAGLGLGVAAAVKYTGGIVIVPLIAAVILTRGSWRSVLLGFGAALAAFLVLNPYALLSFDDFRHGLAEQSAASGDGAGKLGLPLKQGTRYYFESTLWGLGVAPVVFGVAGGVLLILRERRLAWLLVPAPVLFVLFMGVQDRFFARWLLPIYPLLILIATYGVLQALDTCLAKGPGHLANRRRAAAVAAAALLGLQGLVFVVHNDIVMTRSDTRDELRSFMEAEIPEGSRIVFEPIAPADFTAPWIKRAPSHFRIRPDGGKSLVREPKLEDYPASLRPDLLDAYRRAGDCWVITGSIISGRAAVTPDRAPYALRYYRALERQGALKFFSSPGEGTGEFSFDDSYNWRPFSYDRPGPEVRVYRLDDCPA